MAMINDAYNSQYTNNCEIRIKNDNIEIWCLRNIEKGEELFLVMVINIGNKLLNILLLL
jgi:hypothetical protein